MKKITIFLLGAMSLIYSCKKDDKVVSQVVEASYPTITLTGSQYYSIMVGDPLPTVAATSYDSLLQESYSTELDATSLDNQTPGLYIVPITSKNKYGYVGSVNVYVAVTNIPDSVDLSGTYVRSATGGTANVTKVARGLYETDNVGGNAGASTHAFFAQLSPTECVIPDQPTTDGDMAFPTYEFVFDEDGVLTSYTYTIKAGGYGTSPRTFDRE